MRVNRPLTYPDALLTTWFGAGLFPIAPGTAGSLAAFPVAYLAALWAGPAGLAVGAAVITAIGLWAVERYVAATGSPDPGEAVIDEVAGQFLPLIVAPFSLEAWATAFLLFRLFDVWKPWPCSWLDRSLHGGLGVMADDLAAGAYAALAIWLLGYSGVW